jgi:chromosome segregation ATPase
MKKIKYTNIKFTLTFILLLLSSVCFSQSKKEQIEILNIRVDSLSQLIASERLINEEKSNQILELSTKLSSLDHNINILKNELSKLNSDFEKSNSESKSLKQQLINNEKIIIDLQTQLTLKIDSLNTLKINLKNYKKNEIRKFIVGSRELKVGDTINFEDPETHRWEQIDMSPHFVLYKTPDGWEVQIGSSGNRYLKIESITPP